MSESARFVSIFVSTFATFFSIFSMFFFLFVLLHLRRVHHHIHLCVCQILFHICYCIFVSIFSIVVFVKLVSFTPCSPQTSLQSTYLYGYFPLCIPCTVNCLPYIIGPYAGYQPSWATDNTGFGQRTGGLVTNLGNTSGTADRNPPVTPRSNAALDKSLSNSGFSGFGGMAHTDTGKDKSKQQSYREELTRQVS